MNGYLIDLFFSFKGRVGREEWLIGTLVLLALAAAGVHLFNDDGFDESLNAVRSSPTMAAFLWALLSLFAFTALSAKRLQDCGRAPWLAHTIWIPGLLAISGWGLGILLSPEAGSLETLVLLGLMAHGSPAVIGCATLPTEEGG